MRGEMRGRMERAQGWRARTDGERAERCAGGMEGAQGGMECLREGMAGAQRGGMFVCWGMERWREGMEGARRAPRRGGSTAHPPAGTRSPQRRGRPRGWGRSAGRSGGGGSPKSVRSPWEAMLQAPRPRLVPLPAPVPHIPNCGVLPVQPKIFPPPAFEASQDPTAPELLERSSVITECHYLLVLTTELAPALATPSCQAWGAMPLQVCAMCLAGDSPACVSLFALCRPALSC